MAPNTCLGKCCISGTLHEGTPTGTVETIDNLQTYVSKPSDGSKAKTIIFFTDIFGWDFKNVRLIADTYASAGFTAYVPDLLHNDSLPIEFLQTVEPPLKVREQLSVTDKAKNTEAMMATLGPFLGRHTEAIVQPEIDSFIAAVRAIPGTGKVGAIGFCWGGRYAIIAAHGKVDAAFACHPALTSVPGDYEAVSKPLALAVGEKDSLLDLESVEKIKEELGKKEVETEVKVYEDQVHGFAIRGDWNSEKDKKSMDESFKQGVDWFNKHLA